MSDTLKVFISVFLAVNASVLLIFLVYKLTGYVKLRRTQDRVNHFGDSAEIKVEKYIQKNLPSAKLLKDLYLKTETGLTELDALLLCDRGIFVNDNSTIKALISREEFYAKQSAEFVEDSFKGSLPAFLAAFSKSKSLTKEDVDEIRRMIDSYEEG